MNKNIISILLMAFSFLNVRGQVWKNNNIGIDNSVPAPWQPLSITGTSDGYIVSCWGRAYQFRTSSLLLQATANGSELLERPVALQVGNMEQWQPISKKILKTSASEIQLELVSKILGEQKQNVICKTKISVYYDGLIFYKIELNSSTSLSNRISLNIPLKKDFSRLIHRWNNPSATDKQWWISSAFPPKDQVAYIPYFWMGNAEKGLFWFAESPNNWLNYKNKDAITFSNYTNINNTSAVLNLVKSGQLSTTTWKFEFGLQATPVKPIPAQKRNWVLGGASTSTVDIIWPDPGKPHALKQYGYPEAVNIKSFTNHVTNVKSNGKKAIVYNCLSYLSDASSEGKQFKAQWNINAKADMAGDVRAYSGSFARINFTDKDYQDFIVWKSDQLLRDAKFDGYYLDNVMIENLNASKTIKTFSSTKEKLPYYPILEARKLHERFYKMVKGRGRDNIVVTHSSSRIIPPILAFGDAYVSGEQYRQERVHVQDDYLKISSLEAFQTEFSGYPFGLSGIFLPAFKQQNYLIAEPTRALAAVLLQHDIKAWPIWSATIVWDEINKALNAFPGFLTSTFTPYYATNPLTKTKKTSILAGTYKNIKGEYLCIISNISSQLSNAVIEFNDIALSNYEMRKLTPRGKIKTVGGKNISAEILAKDYFIFYLSPKASKK